MNLKKKIVIGALALTAIGTIGGSEGYPPFYTKKIGTSVGINIGVVNDFQPGSKHYGLNLGLINILNEDSEVSGINLGLGMANSGVVNGINAHIFLNIQYSKTIEPETAGRVNGLEIGVFNKPKDFRDYSPMVINGLQVGLANDGRGNLFQFGVYNYNCSKDGKSTRGVVGLNWRFD